MKNASPARARRAGGAGYGYSLTEVMMVVAILGIISATAAPVMMQLTNFWRMTLARNDIERDARESLDQINMFLRQAKKDSVVIDRYSSSQPPFSRIAFTTQQGQQITYYQNTNSLCHSLVYISTHTECKWKNLAYISFTYPRTEDPTIISVAVTMQVQTYLQRQKALQLSIQKVRIMN